MKFGTFKGVFVPSTEAILGTVLFLLLPTLAGDAGLVAILGVIVLAHTVTFATSFSLADCATNLNRIGSGGMYALSKKSLGKAFGGSIGIQLYFAQAASIGFYCIGFAEPLQPIIAPFIKSLSLFKGDGLELFVLQKQMIASAVFIIFFIFAIIGADFTLKIQSFIMVILIVSVCSIFISPFTDLQFGGDRLYYESFENINLFGNRSITLTVFFLTFTQFFPAVTGIDAGVGMSGDLKDPKYSLVKGTFSAIIVTFFIYIIAAIVFSMIKKIHLVTGYAGNSPTGNLLTDLLGLSRPFPENIFGLMILLGILFATSSSALSCFMTAPRTLQSLSRDDILPRQLMFLSRDFKKGGREPRYAAVVTFFVGFSIIWIGNINVAAMIVGICFLVVYGWVNGSAFLERISGNPTFRPTSRGHWLISFYGFASSVMAILLFSWKAGLIIVVSQIIIFRLLLKYKAGGRLEGVWWGVLFSLISKGLQSLKKVVQGAKNWRPIITAVAFSGKNSCPDAISRLGDMIAAYKGLVNYLIIGKNDNGREILGKSHLINPTFIESGNDLTSTVLNVIQVPLVQDLSTNTVLLEYSKSIDSVKIIKDILKRNNNILLLKNGEKLAEYRSVDIWWRGEKNGNLMVLIAYIIHSTLHKEEGIDFNLRIIRMLKDGEGFDHASEEIHTLLENGRIDGDTLILPHADAPFEEILESVSKTSDIIMMGIPGNYIEKDEKKLFNLDEFFFDKEIEKYSHLPPILFVNSATTVSLVEL